MIRFEDSPGMEAYLRCSLHTVSLDALAPEFLKATSHVSNGGIVGRTEAWIKDASQDSLDHGAKSINLPRWRFNTRDLRPEQLPMGFPHLIRWNEQECFSTTSEFGLPENTIADMFNIGPRFEWGDFQAISYC